MRLINSWTKLLVLCGLLVLLTACAPGDPDLAWQKIINEKAIIVDVRTQEEYDRGHIPDARLIPYDQFEAMIGQLGTDKNVPIVLYCRRGVRSDAAQEILAKHGFTNVTNGRGYEALLDAQPK